MRDRTKLVHWIRRQQNKDGLDRFVLRHAAGKMTSIAEYRIEEGVPAEDYANMICMAAKDDADGLGGAQKYSVASFYKDRPEIQVERFAFREYGEGDEEGENDFSLEDPNGKGLLSQLMRHNEANNRTSVLAMDQVLRALHRTLEQTMNRNSELEERHTYMMTTMEELISLKHERDIQTLKQAADMKRQEMLGEKLALLMPILVNKIKGTKLLPAETTLESQIILNLGRSLNPEQLAALQSALKPEQLIAFMELFQAAEKAEAERLAKAAEKEKSKDKATGATS